MTEGGEALFKLTAYTALFFALHNPFWQDKERATEILENAEIKPIRVGGYSWLGCGVGDFWRTEFKGQNKSGAVFNGVVCEGVWFFKGATIRYEETVSRSLAGRDSSINAPTPN